MAAGKALAQSIDDPIVRAIALAEAGTTGEIRVHLSKRLWERNTYGRALKLFERFGMARTNQRNAVLFYVNLRRHRFAILGDQGIHDKLGREYWPLLARKLTEELRSTDPERAIARTIEALGQEFKLFFSEETV